MSTRRAKSRQPEETLTAEFTSGQLIIGICVALFVALTCFLFGVVVGKVDPSNSGTETVAARAVPENPAGGPALEGVQTSQSNLVKRINDRAPREVDLPGSNAPAARSNSDTGRGKLVAAPEAPNRDRNAAPSATAKPSTALTVRASGTAAPGDQSTEIPPPSLPAIPRSDLPPPANMDKPAPPEKPAAAEKKPVTVAKNIPLETLPVATPEKPGEKPGEKPAAEAEKPKPAAQKPASKPVETPPVKPVAPAPAPAPAPAAAGGFGVQVASFLGDQRVQKAQDFQRRLRDNASIESRIFPSEDGSAHRVIIVGYPDKPAAAAACAELRKKEAFKGAFVKALP